MAEKAQPDSAPVPADAPAPAPAPEAAPEAAPAPSPAPAPAGDADTATTAAPAPAAAASGTAAPSAAVAAPAPAPATTSGDSAADNVAATLAAAAKGLASAAPLNGAAPPQALAAAGVHAPKLFVGQIPRIMTQDAARAMFVPYGAIFDFTLLRDRMTGQSRGAAFLTYYEKESAEKAMSTLHEKVTLPGVRLACGCGGYVCARDSGVVSYVRWGHRCA